jgi:hypothetical protein
MNKGMMLKFMITDKNILSFAIEDLILDWRKDSGIDWKGKGVRLEKYLRRIAYKWPVCVDLHTGKGVGDDET